MENAFETKPVLELGQSKTEQRRQLVDATLRGTKTATSSLRTEYQPFTEEPMPNVGEQVVLLGYDDEPVCVVETTEVFILPAGEIDLKFARDEGEGFETVAGWRAAHERFWADERVTDDTMVVCERFKVVEKF